MLSRRAILKGILHLMPSIAVSNIGWLGVVGNTSPSELPVATPIPAEAQILMGIRKRLDSPNNWNKLVYMQGAKRCLVGSLIEELNLQQDAEIVLEEGQVFAPKFDDYSSIPGHYLYLAHKELFPDFVWRDLTRWNDDPETSHADVLRVVDRAIECACSLEAYEEAQERTNWVTA